MEYNWPESKLDENKTRWILASHFSRGILFRSRRSKQYHLNLLRDWLGTNSIVKTKAFIRQATARWEQSFGPEFADAKTLVDIAK